MSGARLAFALAVSLLLTRTLSAQEAHDHEHHHDAQPEPATHSEHQHHANSEEPTQSEPTQSEQEHVPPDPPASQPDHSMPYAAMARMMEMDDKSTTSKVMFDRVEWRHTNDAETLAWDGAAWWGNDYDKLWLKTEGERRAGATENARIEALWDHVASRWWSLQTGVRQDFGPGPSRTWAAFGVEGTAPGFIDIEATTYLGESGHVAARLSAARDVLFSQRLILQPEIEANLFAQEDPENRIGAGLSSIELAMRLRYEIRREFATYLGTVWARRWGETATLRRAAGEDSDELLFVAGFRVWF
jgi:copper resistance protein B